MSKPSTYSRKPINVAEVIQQDQTFGHDAAGKPISGRLMTTLKLPRIRGWRQSPLDPRRWCLELTCGHDVWETSDRTPRRRVTHECPHGCTRSTE